MNVQPLRTNVLVAENATTYKTTESGLILDGVNSTRDSKTATKDCVLVHRAGYWSIIARAF